MDKNLAVLLQPKNVYQRKIYVTYDPDLELYIATEGNMKRYLKDRYRGLRQFRRGMQREKNQLFAAYCLEEVNFEPNDIVIDCGANYGNLFNKLRTIKTNNILIFSNHSIEQVTLLNLRMFEQILSLDAKVKGVHVEPVGWQLIDGWGFCYNIEPQGARQYYNRNFLLILEHLHKHKLITEPTIIPNFFGIHALENMGTLVKYSSH